MGLVMKEIIGKEKNVELENLNGQMEVNILVNFMIIIFMERVLTPGVINVCIKETGKIIKWMVKVNFYGLMVEDILVVIKMIKKKAMVYLNGNSIN